MLTGLYAIGGGEGVALAQLPFPPPPPKLPEELPVPRSPVPILPPVPPVPEKPTPSSPTRVLISTIRVVGNTALADYDLETVTNKYEGRELTPEDMEALRLELTMLYVDRGYVTSGAIIPDQTITEETLTVQIIEGTLSSITVEGNRHLWSSYVRDRIELGVTRPVNVMSLQERLQFLQRDPHIEQLHAELKPEVELGRSTLAVRVKEGRILHAGAEFNNFNAPAVGAEQGIGTVEAANVTGAGDSLMVQYGRSTGVELFNARYAVPLNRYDTTFSAQYRRFSLSVQAAPFDELDIENKAEIISLSLRQPVYRSLEDEFAVSLIGEYESNDSTLLGQPFEFVPGATGGEFKVSALRFAQEYTRRTTEQVVAVFSRFSVGIGALGATGRSAVPQSATGQFFSWLGQAQWVRQLPLLRAHLVARTTMQFSNAHLFPLEQLAVGGRYSVRGYREFTFVRDNGFLATLEFRVPVYSTAAGVDRVYLVPFADVGRSWNSDVPDELLLPGTTSNTADRTLLASVGIGLIASITKQSRFEVYWGHQLNHLRLGRGNLQDHGVHLQFVVQAF